jgi:tRNA uridine 5-carboxymethylaminomethyl modification enzyme
VGLSGCLAELGFEVLRLKTGTPCRLNARSIDFSKLKIQPGDENPEPFSFRTKKISQEQLPCYLTFTNEKTHQIIRDNLHRSPLYSGRISSRGPRYCPSIEDKVVKFADKERHQIFLEPEGRLTQEVYVNGVSTSLPQDVQISMIQSIEGLENAELMRFGYAVEYDFVQPTQLHPTLETKLVEGLYLAGQINGTSGYEEAACQGLMASINAVLKIRGSEPFILKRHEAYIGVLIDDLVTKGTLEPYRMFTSRAEHRLILRQDNADQRLMEHGHRFGLITAQEFGVFDQDRKSLADYKEKLPKIRHNGKSLLMHVKAPETSLEELYSILQPEGIKRSVAFKLSIDAKYEGYIERELRSIGRAHHLENKKIPVSLDFSTIQSMSRESREKFTKIRPATIGQASRIAGIRPSDIAILSVVVARHHRSAVDSE